MATKSEVTEVTEVTEVYTLTANELADEMNVNPKSLRRFMRSLSDDRAGRGGKYLIPRSVANQIIAKYNEGPNRKTVTYSIKD